MEKKGTFEYFTFKNVKGQETKYVRLSANGKEELIEVSKYKQTFLDAMFEDDKQSELPFEEKLTDLEKEVKAKGSTLKIQK